MACDDKVCQGDSGVLLNFLIEDQDGNYLEDVTEAVLLMKGGNDHVELELDCEVDNTPDRTCHYTLQEEDTSGIGDYKLRIRYTTSSGRRTTIDYGELEVVDI